MNDTQKIERRFELGLSKPSDNYQAILGPSYLSGLPSEKEWVDFIKCIKNPATKEFAEIWREKATVAKGVPLRSDFNFQTLVKYGKNLAIYKRTEEGRWLTTFCGDGIVEDIKLELSHKYIDEYADEETLKFWMANIQQITEQCKPIFEVFTLEYTKEHHKTSQTLNLPLRSGSNDSADMFICYDYFLYL